MHKIKCHLQRSNRYHIARERNLNYWFNLFFVLALLSGSILVVSILASAPTWLGVVAGFVVATTLSIEQIGGQFSKARLHSGLVSEFMDLERYLHIGNDQKEVNLNSIQAKILSI